MSLPALAFTHSLVAVVASQQGDARHFAQHHRKGGETEPTLRVLSLHIPFVCGQSAVRVHFHVGRGTGLKGRGLCICSNLTILLVNTEPPDMKTVCIHPT
jgi:hypothetical protein